MANPKAKTINLLLEDGTLNGVISIADSSWNKGELYSAPRESVENLISSDACNRFGVYLLLSEDMVYVGQASDLSKRIKQHIIGKSWWERVVILTTSDNSFDRADIDYIEASLISKASKNSRLDCDNKNQGNKPNINRFKEVVLQQYLDEALFLIELIGINVFSDLEKKRSAKNKTELISSIKNCSEEQMEIRAKKEAIRFLENNGIIVGSNVNYSKRQDNKAVFWINPKTNCIDKDWTLILNDQFKNEIILIHIPVGTFNMKSESVQGLVTRHDKPNRIDLSISADSLIDQRSKCDFSTCQVKRIKY